MAYVNRSIRLQINDGLIVFIDAACKAAYDKIGINDIIQIGQWTVEDAGTQSRKRMVLKKIVVLETSKSRIGLCKPYVPPSAEKTTRKISAAAAVEPSTVPNQKYT